MAEDEPLLRPRPATGPSPPAPPEKPTSWTSTVMGALAPLFMLSAVLVPAIFANSAPYLAAYLALTMSLVGLVVDFLNYRRGTTAFFPKILDTSLCILWTIHLLALLLSPPFSPTRKFILIYGGLINILFLALISFVSTKPCINRPWIFQLAADQVADEALWKPHPHQSPEMDAKQANFLAVCGSVTNFWGGIFLLMAVGTFVNGYYNTDLTDDFQSLTHDNRTMNVLFGIVWNIVCPVLGKRGTPMVVERSKKLLVEKEGHGKGLETPGRPTGITY